MRYGNAYRVYPAGRYGYGRYGWGYPGYGWGYPGYGWGYPGWGYGWGVGIGIGIGWGAGYFVNWGFGGPCAPYYGYYPSYGMRFGYGCSYYEPAYQTVIVEPEPYCPADGQVVEEQIYLDEGVNPEDVIQDGGIEEGPINQGPAGAPLVEEGGAQAPAAQADNTDGASTQARGPHPDFEPSVKDFLAGDYQGALTHLDNVVRDEPDNGEAWLAVMHANFALGRYGPAAHGLAQAADLDAFPRGYRFDPRPLYPEAGRWDELVGKLDKHIASSPKDADALVVRAYLYVALGEKQQAQKLIDETLVARGDDETAPRLAMALLPPPPAPKGAAEQGRGSEDAPAAR